MRIEDAVLSEAANYPLDGELNAQPVSTLKTEKLLTIRKAAREKRSAVEKHRMLPLSPRGY